jgi:two-component system, OmpR family, phosphate regulon sensor histidine kinase PhoR
MRPTRVLVAEDDREYLDLMARHLRRRGCEIETAENGEQALDHLRVSETFDVLVTDLMMPGIDGYELLRQARQLDPMLEVVVISGVGTLESAISSMRQGGAFDYLAKPLETIRDLSLAVERAAAYRQLRLEHQELEERIRAERELLSTVLANTGDQILAADENGLLTLANPAAEVMLGVDHPVGKDAWTVLPAPLAVLVTHWQAFDNRQPTVTEVPWPPERVHTVSLAPIAGQGNGRSAGWVMVLRDITHLKRLDQVKMRLLTETARKIGGPLDLALQHLGDLQAMLGAKSKTARQLTTTMGGSLISIQQLTRELVEMVEVESGGSLNLEPMDVGQAVEEWAHKVPNGSFKEKSLVLILNISDDVPVFPADRKLLQALIERLVRQAAWRARVEGKLRVSVRNHEGQIWLEVTDDGEPLQDSDLPHRLDHFLSAEPGMFGPNGIELAMIKALVDRLGGQIWIRSHPSSGNTLAIGFSPPA